MLLLLPSSNESYWLPLVDPNGAPSLLDVVLGVWQSAFVHVEAPRGTGIKVMLRHTSGKIPFCLARVCTMRQVYASHSFMNPYDPAGGFGFLSKSCGNWSSLFVDDDACDFSMSRFGIWAPWGRPSVAVTRATRLFSLFSPPPLEYDVEYSFGFDASLPLFLLVGLLLWHAAPRLSYSRTVHVSSGTVLGAVGGNRACTARVLACVSSLCCVPAPLC